MSAFSVTCPHCGRSVGRYTELGMAIELGHEDDYARLCREIDLLDARIRACGDKDYAMETLARGAHARGARIKFELKGRQ